MVEGADVQTAGGMSSEAARAATGKDWAEWFAILDAAGAQAMDHKQIVAYLVENHQVSPWWQQGVTVAYEQARGLREKHETPEGYQVSANKTMPYPVSVVYGAWLDAEGRGRWLPDPGFTIRKATENKSLRITWVGGETRVDVHFYPKGENKTQVQLQHNKLPDSEAAGRMKAYWAEALARLNAFLGGD